MTIIFCNNPKNITKSGLSKSGDDVMDWGDWSIIDWRIFREMLLSQRNGLINIMKFIKKTREDLHLGWNNLMYATIQGEHWTELTATKEPLKGNGRQKCLQHCSLQPEVSLLFRWSHSKQVNWLLLSVQHWEHPCRTVFSLRLPGTKKALT